jgi:hypothetical protein
MPINRLEGFIYYSNATTVPDRAFERAARWSARSSIAVGYIVEILSVTTKQDFIDAWNGILNQANSNRVTVDSVSIYTHASKGESDQDGLEFANGPGGTTLTQSDILALPRLPWFQGKGFMYLHGCNTGLVGDRGWCPAQAFLNGQGNDLRQANGEAGFAYFSKNSETYVESSPTDQELYLWAFRRRRNGPLGDGGRINPARFLRNTLPELVDQLALEFLEEKSKLGVRYSVKHEQTDDAQPMYRLTKSGPEENYVDIDELSQEVLGAMKKKNGWPVIDGWEAEDSLLQVLKAIVSRC